MFFSTLSWFRGFVVWSVQVSKSDRPPINRTLSVWRIVRAHALWSCCSKRFLPSCLGPKRPPCRLMPGGQETKSVRQIAEQVSVLFLLKLEISVIECGPLNVSWANYSDLKAMMCNLSLSLPISTSFFKANTSAKKSKLEYCKITASLSHFLDFYTKQALKVWRSPLHAVFY